eukprot:361064-Chlamydomonas_euryale.AAC.7
MSGAEGPPKPQTVMSGTEISPKPQTLMSGAEVLLKPQTLMSGAEGSNRTTEALIPSAPGKLTDTPPPPPPTGATGCAYTTSRRTRSTHLRPRRPRRTSPAHLRGLWAAFNNAMRTQAAAAGWVTACPWDCGCTRARRCTMPNGFLA